MLFGPHSNPVSEIGYGVYLCTSETENPLSHLRAPSQQVPHRGGFLTLPLWWRDKGPGQSQGTKNMWLEIRSQRNLRRVRHSRLPRCEVAFRRR